MDCPCPFPLPRDHDRGNSFSLDHRMKSGTELQETLKGHVQWKKINSSCRLLKFVWVIFLPQLNLVNLLAVYGLGGIHPKWMFLYYIGIKFTNLIFEV